MKIAGQVVDQPSEEVLVLHRSNGNIAFKARAVLDISEFEDQVPMPKAPGKLVPGQGWQANTESAAYKDQVANYAKMKMAYIVIKSLEPSEIEWDTVKLDDPSTWVNWHKDLADAKFSAVEIQRIQACCITANSLNEQKLEEAREAFLRGQATLAEESSGPDTEQQSTPSGQPANASE